jgi:MFS transporter, NNP family, nitrate/nitrite transporter
VYAITFGGFVAFGVYPPTFLRTVYHLGTTDAASRAAGFWSWPPLPAAQVGSVTGVVGAAVRRPRALRRP